MYVDTQGDRQELASRCPWGRGEWVKLFCDKMVAWLGEEVGLMQPL